MSPQKADLQIIWEAIYQPTENAGPLPENTLEALRSLIAVDRKGLVKDLYYIEFDVHVSPYPTWSIFWKQQAYTLHQHANVIVRESHYAKLFAEGSILWGPICSMLSFSGSVIL